MTRENAYIAIASIEGAALLVAQATAREMDLEDARHIVKQRAMNRLISTGVASSATAAEKLVHTDEEYSLHLRAQRDAVVEKIVLEGKLVAAKLRARLAVELVALDPDDDGDLEGGPSLEDYKSQALKLEHEIDAIDKMLDDHQVPSRADDGRMLGITPRIEMLLRWRLESASAR